LPVDETSIHFLDTLIYFFGFFIFNISISRRQPGFVLISLEMAIGDISKIAENFKNMIFGHISC